MDLVLQRVVAITAGLLLAAIATACSPEVLQSEVPRDSDARVVVRFETSQPLVGGRGAAVVTGLGEELLGQRMAKLVRLLAHLTGVPNVAQEFFVVHCLRHILYGVRICYEKLQAKIQVDYLVSVFST